MTFKKYLSENNSLFNEENQDFIQEFSIFDNRLSKRDCQIDLYQSDNELENFDYCLRKNLEKKIKNVHLSEFNQNNEIINPFLNFSKLENEFVLREEINLLKENQQRLSSKFQDKNQTSKFETNQPIKLKENKIQIENRFIENITIKNESKETEIVEEMIIFKKKEKITKNLKEKFIENSKKIILSKNLLEKDFEKNIDISNIKNFRNYFFNFRRFLKVLFSKCKCSSVNCCKSKKCKEAKKNLKKINRKCNLDNKNSINLKILKNNLKILKKCKHCSKCEKKEIKITPAKGAIFKIIIKNLKDIIQKKKKNKEIIEEIQIEIKISKAKIVKY